MQKEIADADSYQKVRDATPILIGKNKSAVNVIFRQHSHAYNAPTLFFKVFSKKTLTVRQIKLLVYSWNRWFNERNFDSPDPNGDEKDFWMNELEAYV